VCRDDEKRGRREILPVARMGKGEVGMIWEAGEEGKITQRRLQNI